MLLMLLQMPLPAQDGVLKVRNGKIIDGELFLKLRYAMPSFASGKIVLTDNKVYAGKFNVDTYTQTLSIIDEKGDTSSVVSEKSVVSMSAGGYLFYKIKNSYIQILDTDGRTSLGLLKSLTIGRKKSEGAFGMTDDVAMMTKVVSTEDNFYDMLKKGLWEGDVHYSYKELPYLVKDGRLYMVTKQNLKKFYPKRYPEVEKYIAEQKPDLSKRGDVSLLYKFMIQ